MHPIQKYLFNYFSLNDYLVSQQEAELEIREGVSFRGTNILILIIAIFIASLGLNTNSTAVIIGAMLISPLMGPIIGVGLGIGIHDFELVKRAIRNLIMAAGFSILTSTLYFIISPVSAGHSELLARTSPTIYDVLIGFFGGAAGIIAIGSKSKGNVIPGVAIATALMPPLCTVGYGMATLQPTYFLGAFYLFLINSIYIALATFIGVKLMHYKPIQEKNPIKAKKVRRLVYTISILTLLPSLYLTYNMLRQSRFSSNAEQFVAQELKFPSTQVLSMKASMQKGDKTISVTLIGKILPTDSLRLALSSRLKFYGLEGTKLNIVQGDTPDLSSLTTGSNSMRDIYEMAQTSITAKQVTIDSLKSVIAVTNINDSIGGQLAPEIRVLFPQVEEIAVTRAIFGNIETTNLDTMDIALVKYATQLPAAKRHELEEYLKARLRYESISIIDIGNQINLSSTPQTTSHGSKSATKQK